MLFWKKNKYEADIASENEDNLYPVVHVMNTLKDYEKEMVQKEVDSLWELNEIRSSFDTVLKGTESFQERLADFEQNFMSIEQASSGFADVKDTVAQSVQHAQDEVTELKSSSMQVADYFGEMENTFVELQKAVEKIKQCTDKIVSIADQTNILAINASIEAARAGEAGKGFAVVAGEISKLSEDTMRANLEIAQIINDNNSYVREGIEIADSTRETLLASLSDNRKMTEEMEQITNILDSLLDHTQQIESELLVSVRLGEENVTMTDTCCSTTEELLTSSNTLKGNVEKYIL